MFTINPSSNNREINTKLIKVKSGKIFISSALCLEDIVPNLSNNFIKQICHFLIFEQDLHILYQLSKAELQ